MPKDGWIRRDAKAAAMSSRFGILKKPSLKMLCSVLCGSNSTTMFCVL